MKRFCISVSLMVLLATAAISAPQLVAFSRWDSIWIGDYGHNGNTWQKRIVATPGHWCGQPALSPDGRRIAFAAHAEIDGVLATVIKVADVKTQSSWQLTDGPYDSSPCWSPDGRQIVFTKGGQCDKLWIVGSRLVKGKLPAAKRLTSLSANVAENNACWKGNLIVFEACLRQFAKDGFFITSIMAKDMSTGSEWKVVNSPEVDCHHPDITAVDGKIVYEGYDSPKDYYSAERMRKAKLRWKWLCDSNIGEPLCHQNLPDAYVHGQSPVWSRDGLGVFFNAEGYDSFSKLIVGYYRLEDGIVETAIGGAYDPAVLRLPHR